MSYASAIIQLGDRTYLAEMPQKPMCDFCSEPLDVTAARCFLACGAQVRVEDPETDKRVLTLNSDAHWTACAVCAPMVAARDKVGILNRSKEKFKEKHGWVEPEMLAYVQESMFWAHFGGEEHPASEHPSETSI